MTDLVKRLEASSCSETCMMSQAAKEIIRLRDELNEERKNSAAWERLALQRTKDLKALQSKLDTGYVVPNEDY